MDEFENCCESITKTGFGRIGLPPEMRCALDSMVLNFESIDDCTKKSYCVEENTDERVQ